MSAKKGQFSRSTTLISLLIYFTLLCFILKDFSYKGYKKFLISSTFFQLYTTCILFLITAKKWHSLYFSFFILKAPSFKISVFSFKHNLHKKFILNFLNLSKYFVFMVAKLLLFAFNKYFEFQSFSHQSLSGKPNQTKCHPRLSSIKKLKVFRLKGV